MRPVQRSWRAASSGGIAGQDANVAFSRYVLQDVGFPQGFVILRRICAGATHLPQYASQVGGPMDQLIMCNATLYPQFAIIFRARGYALCIIVSVIFLL